jgi:hypothetical protein
MRPSLVRCIRPAALPPVAYVDPRTLSSTTVPGFQHFTQPCRRLEFEYHQNDIRGEGLRYVRSFGKCELRCWLAGQGGEARVAPAPSFSIQPVTCLKVTQADTRPALAPAPGIREYLRTSVVKLAETNPETEIIVRSIRGTSAPVVRAFYSPSLTSLVRAPRWRMPRIGILADS